MRFDLGTKQQRSSRGIPGSFCYLLLITVKQAKLLCKGNARGINGISPVSYTHLDVYKRQDNYDLLVSLRNVKHLSLENPILVTLLFTAVLIALLYWFFGTELGSGIRATGANPNMSRAQGKMCIRDRCILSLSPN